MKKINTFAAICLAVLSLTGCNKQEDEVCAFVKRIKDDKVIVDVAEYITREDTDRIKELELDEDDLPNGYYIHNSEEELTEYTLIEKTVYNFIDWGNDFVEYGEDRNVSVMNREAFIKYLSTYKDAEPKMPFFILIKGDKVISITEKIMM